MSDIERLRQTLARLFVMIEDATIENDVYFDVILESGVNLPTLRTRVEEAQRDPEKRKEVQAGYAEMWRSIETLGVDVTALDLLRNLPPTEKPN